MRPEQGFFFRSDHFPFAKAGVPAISFTPGNDLVNGGTARGNALAADYTAKRYHQPDDEYDPNWNFKGMVRDWQLLHNDGYRRLFISAALVIFGVMGQAVARGWLARELTG